MIKENLTFLSYIEPQNNVECIMNRTISQAAGGRSLSGTACLVLSEAGPNTYPVCDLSLLFIQTKQHEFLHQMYIKASVHSF